MAPVAGAPPGDRGRPRSCHDRRRFAVGPVTRRRWGGRWVSPEEALEHLREQEDEVRERERDRARWRSRFRAANEADTAHRLRELRAEADAERAERLRREFEWEAEVAEDRRRLREFWRAFRDDGIRDHARWADRARRMGQLEAGAEWIEWGSDRAIDVLVPLTGPAGERVRTAYTYGKRIGKGIGEAMETGDAGRIITGIAEGRLDHAFSKYAGRATKDALRRIPRLQRVFGHPDAHFPDFNVDRWRNLPVSKLGRIVANPDGYSWSNDAVRSAIKNAGADHLGEAAIRDPVKNLLEGKPAIQGRDPLSSSALRWGGLEAKP